VSGLLFLGMKTSIYLPESIFDKWLLYWQTVENSLAKQALF